MLPDLQALMARLDDARARATQAPLVQALAATRSRLERASAQGAARLAGTALGRRLLEDLALEVALLVEAIDAAPRPAPTGPFQPRGAERRVHPRYAVNLLVRFARNVIRGGDDPARPEAAILPARDVSAGGIYVVLEQPLDLTRFEVVHVSVSTALGTPPFEARAVVMRCDGAGVGLRWLPERDQARQLAELVAAVSQAGG